MRAAITPSYGRSMTTMSAFHDTHARDVLRFLRGLTRDPGLAEDLLQETMLRAWACRSAP
jgi:DNA-directed RNA polymerase specialized sigma24 family protein